MTGLGLAISTAAVWFITTNLMAVLTYAACLCALALLAVVLMRGRAPVKQQEPGLPDWSVTILAIERPDVAVAISDRAGRLVCANSLYQQWFGAQYAPQQVEVDDSSIERLTRAARSAWREGQARIDLVVQGEGVARRWRGTVERAGRGEDFQIWRFEAIQSADPVGELVGQLDGKMGRTLAKSGIAAALVDPDGTIRGASGGFAEAATGDPAADMAGREFVSFLRQDEDDQIGWARDGNRGSSLTLYFVPVADPDEPDEPDPDMTPTLMLLVEAGVGIGGGQAEASAAVPHLEALLGQLPLGLAMADRDGRLLFANPAFMRAAGREGEKPPVYPTDLVAREDKGALSDAIRRYAQGPAAAGDLTVRLSKGGESFAALDGETYETDDAMT
ncbi:MAG: PAS domain-containing protein, partial [Sphingomonadaceae bacterium]|nr:PAS domain-containing protein [Sphingomonadaceae bacterium]